MILRLNGLNVAPFTPMNFDGSLNLNMIEPLAQVLIERGAQAFYLCGSTGEGMLLTLSERMQIVERWRAIVGTQLPLVVHVGHVCIEESKILAAHAQKIGITAISSVGPTIVPPKNIDIVIACCNVIAASAPKLPFYYYHKGALSGLKITAFEYLQKARNTISTLVGIKFTHEDLLDLGRCLRMENGRFDILFGRDEMLLGALAVGVQGAVGGTYNFLSPLANQVMSSFLAGDYQTAQSTHSKMQDLIAIFSKFGGMPAIKAAMKMLNLECGPVRLPHYTLNEQEVEQLCIEIEKAWPEFQKC